MPDAAPAHRSAFDDAYDARRMAKAQRSWRTQNALAADAVLDDLSPVCTSCGDLLATGSVYCAECGVRVVINTYTPGESRGSVSA